MNKLINSIKVFFLDLDGTLIDGKKDTISKINIDTIKKLNHHKDIVISTGRYGQSALKFMPLLNIKYAICANGAIIVDDQNNVLFSQALSSRQISAIVAFARKNKLSFKCDDQKIAYGIRSFVGKIIARKLGYQTTRSYAFLPGHNYKFVLWGKFGSKIKQLTEELKSLVHDLSIVNSAHGYTIEVTNHLASKGYANRFVWQKILKIKNIKQSAHIGDSMNDSTVIGNVGYLIALKNSPKALKKIAHIIGPKYTKGGVAKVLKGQNLKRTKVQ